MAGLVIVQENTMSTIAILDVDDIRGLIDNGKYLGLEISGL